jgi:hypothetical protein
MDLFTNLLKRNRVNSKRAGDLVFIHTNLFILSGKRNINTYNEVATKMWDVYRDE